MSAHRIAAVLAAATLLAPLPALAQGCPEKSVNYFQSFTAGGESDISARHQQVVLKRKCPGIETVVQYKTGASGAIMLNAPPFTSTCPARMRRATFCARCSSFDQTAPARP